AVGKKEVVLPMSKIKYEIAKMLEKEKWIKRVEVVDPADSVLLDKKEEKKERDTVFKSLKISIKYKKSGKPFISHIKRVSRPGLRLYVNKDEIPEVLNNFGIAIISTPRGLMTNKEARVKGVGGEVICEIY
ncbi:30S ribosomal protein S8, partial [bacterium]|nr:30S ribosomal protein S8 [bacterium]